MRSINKFLMFFTIIVCWSLFLNTVSCGNGIANGLQKIINRGSLVVGVCKIDQPPFYQRDKNGKLSGIDIDIANALAEALKVKLIINEEAPNWDALVPLLEQNKIDLAISFFSTTVERSKHIFFSKPYAKVRQSIILNRFLLSHIQEKKTLKNIFNGTNKEILGTYAGSAYIKFATYLLPQLNLKEFQTQEDIYPALLKGEIMGIFADELETRAYLERNPEAKLKLINLSIKDTYDLISIGISQDNSRLLEFINTFINVNKIMVNIDNLIINPSTQSTHQ